MESSVITIKVKLDEQKLTEQIEWNATGSSVENMQQAKGLLLSLWDGEEKTALRIDLWTKNMMIDEMAEFYYQTLTAMADTYQRATRNSELTNDIKDFAKTFIKKFRDSQLKENK